MTAADRPSVTDDARAEAVRRWPRLHGPEETLTYPREAVREHARAGFIQGAEWAAARAETTTATTEDIQTLDARWFERWATEQPLADKYAGYYQGRVSAVAQCREELRHLLATAPTRYEVARAIRLSRTNGLCKPGVRCDLCDCAQEYEDDLALRDADAVLALLRGGDK